MLPVELATDTPVPTGTRPARKPWQESPARTWIPPVVVAVFVIGFVAQLFVVPSGSMENTLLVGDHVLVDKVRFGPPPRWGAWLLPDRAPQRNDVIAFKSPVEPGVFLVKRLVGLPGDRIRLIHGVLYRNGRAVQEPWVIHQLPYDPGRDDWPDAGLLGQTEAWQKQQWNYFRAGEIVVPPGHDFVLGDNRDVSFDSRYWGFVPQQNIIGRPLLIYWSTRGESDNVRPLPLLQQMRAWISALVHLPVRTRWTRTLRVIR